MSMLSPLTTRHHRRVHLTVLPVFMCRNDLASLRELRSGPTPLPARLAAPSSGSRLELADCEETRPLIVHENDGTAAHSCTGMEYLDTEVLVPQQTT